MLESSISQVVVYARGAMVTRQVRPRELPDGEVDLVIPGLTPMAEPGSVRAAVRGGSRQVIAVHTALVVPADTAEPGPTRSQVLELENRRARRVAEKETLERQRSALLATALDPGLAARAKTELVGPRTQDALSAAALLAEIGREADRRIAVLDGEIEAVDREITAARLADAQASSKARMGTGHPTRSVTVRLGGRGAIDELTVSYQVAAARWWPLYTLRIAEGGSRAEWWMEALVAQRSGEDWDQAHLGLSTADLISDARLPELPSLRLGRAQQPAPRGFRPPPGGLDLMFAGYDRIFLAVEVETRTKVVAVAESAAVASPKPKARKREVQERRREQAEAPPAPPGPEFFGAVSASAQMMPPPGAAPAPAKGGFSLGMARAAMANAVPADEEAMAEGGGGEPEPPPPPPPLGLGDTWIDFDRLELAGPSVQQRRGRLAPRADGIAEPLVRAAREQIEAISPVEAVKDPLRERGEFDHRYEGEHRVEIPADGIPHRLRLATRASAPRFRFRCAPREALEVYREVELDNPFDAPLLGGPVDVYVDGTLLLTAPLAPTDRGGRLAVGLGVEERIRVARNTSVKEDTTGLLRGSTAVEHQVSIELRSSLGRPVEVELLERAPVSGDEDLKIEPIHSEPKAERYDQEDRQHPIRGGLRWRLPLQAGERRSLIWGYRLIFPGKNEVVGGNRRE